MNLKKNIARVATAAMVASSLVSMSPAAMAADVVGIKDTLSRETASVTSVAHVIDIATVAGTVANLTITYPTTPNSGFTSLAGTLTVTCGSGTATAAVAGQVVTVTGTSCASPIHITGLTGTNPTAAGSYMVTVAGDATGYFAIPIVTNDTVTVSATVDPSITFDVGADTSTCNAGWNSTTHAVDFGRLLTGSIASSDASANATSTLVAHICTKLSTNATSGAVVTAKNANGADGLKSVSTPTDKIPSVTGTIAAGTPKYGMCVTGTSGHTSATVYPASNAPVTTGTAFTTACTSAAASINAFDGTAQRVWSVPGVTDSAFFQMNLQAAISGTQPAHNDYSDSIVFVATATF
jgi:hypothetical protein